MKVGVYRVGHMTKTELSHRAMDNEVRTGKYSTM